MKMNQRPQKLKKLGYLFCITFLVLCISATSYAQNRREIHGIVTDASNTPLAGVSVGIKGTIN